jgi:hypothetical protein
MSETKSHHKHQVIDVASCHYGYLVCTIEELFNRIREEKKTRTIAL